MATRNFGPGPGAYMLPTTIGSNNHDARMQRMPGFSFGKRTASTRKNEGPGPGAYKVDKITRYGAQTDAINKSTCFGRRQIYIKKV